MSFKEEYKEAFDIIVPSQKFLDDLSEKMHMEQQKTRRINWSYQKPLVAAACVCVLVLAGVVARRQMLPKVQENSTPVTIQSGETEKNATATPGLFDMSAWYQEGDSPEKILGDFVARLSDEAQVRAVYKNSENVFTDAPVLSAEERTQLAKQIENAAVVESPDEVGDKEYYMAEFANGDIIKFSISAEQYFVFQDLEYVYQY